MTAASVSKLHSWHHANYAEAMRDIYTAIGDFSREEIFGRQILVAVYVRPDITNAGLHMTSKQQEEDIPQGKICLLLACGPEAFMGDESYLKATFGAKSPPKPGDWLICRPQDGTPISLFCEGGRRIMAVDRHGEEHPKYDWDGWPCRILLDDQVLGRTSVPHAVV